MSKFAKLAHASVKHYSNHTVHHSVLTAVYSVMAVGTLHALATHLATPADK